MTQAYMTVLCEAMSEKGKGTCMAEEEEEESERDLHRGIRGIGGIGRLSEEPQEREVPEQKKK